MAFLIAICVLTVILTIGAASVYAMFKVLDSVDKSLNELDFSEMT